MNTGYIIIISFYALWIIATIINQFNNPKVRSLLSFDIFHILPRWTFFAPNPGTSDYHILYREMDSNEHVSEFQEIPVHSDRQLFSFFWNPGKRVKKTLLDLAMDMNRLCAIEGINEDNIKISFTYIVFLNFLSSLSLSPGVKSVQFAVLVTKGFVEYEAPRLIICSEFHDV